MRITQPGFYSLSEADYFADPCPRPSLTQTIAKILLERSPMHAWHAHPRLNPRYEPDSDKKFDLGNVAHTLLLGRGKKIIPLNFPDYRTKAAREARDTCLTAGQVPVLGPLLERAHQMREAAEFQLGGPLVGETEVTVCWEDSGWMRTKIDLLAEDHLTIWDYKTTGQQLGADVLGGKMINDGWHIQAAMHEAGLNFLEPQHAGRRRHFFLAQETYPPYAIYTCRLSEASLDLGRYQLARAIDLWRQCMAANKWPGPSREVFSLEMPSWAMRKSMQLEGVGEA